MIKKFLSKVWANILFLETIFLLVFIPLFPKIPLLDVRNTWVYIRSEDFIVLFALLTFLALLVKKKVTLKTPLTIPILLFWIIGAISTIHGVLLIFPTLGDVFPNVAFLSYVRHLEYLSVFFIAYFGVRDKNYLKFILGALVLTFTIALLYGLGQKYFSFPAYLTMNEEFAKGIPIHLSNLSRIPSTFAGHYDFAAYLVLMIPIMASLFFAVRNLLFKFFLLFITGLGFVLLFMTVSRVSFVVVFVALAIVIFFQKRKLFYLGIPIAIILALVVFSFKSTSLLNRFSRTVSETTVLVDAKTGSSLGNVRFEDKNFFSDKIVLQRRVKDKEELSIALAETTSGNFSTASAVLPFKFVPDRIAVVTAVNISTGENLPQGTGYVNLYLSPVTERLRGFFYEFPPNLKENLGAEYLMFNGDFLVKKASAYDLSFTTRFQGEWPRAIEAFQRNVFFGSGYGSVSLAVDNNFLRIFAETGVLGFLAFFALFIILGIYIKKVYLEIDSKLAKSFILGFGAGTIGLLLNATLIDVFEASKIAFTFWAMVGIVLGILVLYQTRAFNLFPEIKSLATSKLAIILYLGVFTMLLFLPSINTYFVGDDFTWLRWIADCQNNCSALTSFANYFTSSDGFFYRPGTKIYFYLMYHNFWLNQVLYHLVSISLHFLISVLVFLLALKVFKNKLLSLASGFVFLILSGSTEAVLWISSTGFLFTTAFGLTSLLLFIFWEETKKKYLLILSLITLFLSLLFQEQGIVFGVFIVLYSIISHNNFSIRSILKRRDYLLLFIPEIIYLLMRFSANSHWFSGDYSYNLIKLPFNFVGNILGYLSLALFGTFSLSLFEKIREFSREHVLEVGLIILVLTIIAFYSYRFVKNLFNKEEMRMLILGFALFLVSLLPFLGLGNITSRYSYLSSIGIVFIIVMLSQKIYSLLRISGKQIAVLVTTLMASIFILFHIIQVQQAYFEWNDAGNKTKNFFISLEATYKNYWSRPDMELHFVNVPIKLGEAWIFPVGLRDAAWFAFKNENVRVFEHSSIVSAKASIGLYPESPPASILLFLQDGSVKEVYKNNKFAD